MTDEAPTVAGMTAVDFTNWRHHPATKIVLQFMRDYRDALQAEMIARWRGRSSNLIDEHEARGRIEQLEELAELEFATMRDFYKPPETEQD